MWGTFLLNPGPPIRPFISTTTNLPPPPERYLAAPNATHTRRRLHPVPASSEDIGGLGKAVFGALQSGPNNPGSNPKQGKKNAKQKQEEPRKEEKGGEISGSDILRALQRASARKAQISSNKKQQKRMADSLNRTRRENANRVDVDYDKVRPLTIKTDWATRLDELEKRLQEFLSI